MIRRACCAVALAVLLLTTAFADTYLEKAKGVDPEKKTLTILVDGKERTFKVDEKAKFESQTKTGKRVRIVPQKEGLKGIKAGDDLSVSTERKDGAEVVTRVVRMLPEK